MIPPKRWKWSIIAVKLALLLVNERTPGLTEAEAEAQARALLFERIKIEEDGWRV